MVVTGGLGFLGSNLAIRLVDLGASVTVIDSLVEGCGGNEHNLAPIAGRVRVIRANVGATSRFRNCLADANVVFNLAGEISHIHSVRFPRRDAFLNASTQLAFLEECAAAAPGIRVVYAGTRQVYGIPRYLPVDEDHPIAPVDFNGIHNYSAMMYHLLYRRLGKLDAVVLNLTNLYGPRMALSIPCQGFLSNFIRKMATGRPLEVFGDGSQLRDPLYVDDAVDAFLVAGAAVCPPAGVYNAGGPGPLGIGRIAEIMSRVGGLPPCAFRPFPPEQKLIDIGSYYADNRRIRDDLGWTPAIAFEDGIRRTLEFYRSELPFYLDSAAGEPECKLTRARPAKTAAVRR